VAKLKAPLMSLGASGQLGKALVFFSWKGLNVVRQHIVPTNPKTQAQLDQRQLMTWAIEAVHEAQSTAANKLGDTDKSAYALWAGIVQAATTWVNQAVRNQIDQYVAGKHAAVYRGGTIAVASGQVTITVYNTSIDPAGITEGYFHYGTSKTALLSTSLATIDVVTRKATKAIAGLTNGMKYYFQFRPSALPDYIGNYSGIYTGTPSA